MTKEEFELEIAEGTVMVDFYATWCGQCKLLGPVLDYVVEDTGVKLVKIDVDEVDWIEGMDVEKLPTVIIYKNGVEKTRFSGYKRKQAILEML